MICPLPPSILIAPVLQLYSTTLSLATFLPRSVTPYYSSGSSLSAVPSSLARLLAVLLR